MAAAAAAAQPLRLPPRMSNHGAQSVVIGGPLLAARRAVGKRLTPSATQSLQLLTTVRLYVLLHK
jgi:hypothetical protein